MSIPTSIYIDGFNFYYGAVKGTSYKWLNFKTLFKRVLASNYDIQTIKYFTARVSGFPNDPQQPMRQQIYLRALRTYIPEIEIVLGSFKIRQKRLPLVNPTTSQRFEYVKIPEEKGSDVNLAVHLLNDGWKGEYDSAVVISNDGDLTEALKMVRDDLNKEVILLTPPKYMRSRNKNLKNAATRCMTIKNSDLANSQLPDPIPNTNIYKPSRWRD